MHPSRWPASFLIAASLGFGLGALPVQQLIAARGGWTGGSNMVLLNFVLPVIAAGIAVLYPRARVAVPAALMLGVSFWLGRMLLADWHFWMWTGGWLVSRTNPLLVIGTIGLAIIAFVCSLLVRFWRVVGLPDQHLRCRRCGYLLTESPPVRCPECGKARARMDP